VARDRPLDPGDALGGGRDRIPVPLALVGRDVARHEGDPGEPERLADLLGGAQMAEMDRIEGPSEEPDPRLTGLGLHPRS